MKKAWILKLIFICSFVLLGERVSLHPDFKAFTKSFVHATSDDSDSIIAIELEDEVEEDALTMFFLSKSFDWIVINQFLGIFILVVFIARPFFHQIPVYLRFQNLRL
ncbi:hypothetical protein [Aquirufa lenticrescens]|uniref:hypothetical protein n=1 Tax=Aquirufa lenticrescens TaxID=2696560 RepID=UPI001CAA78E7|nr:hypothetical protein [Aquirufa lenticrescens]UAJ14134.1 hypothetical protein G9X62_06000 [Aquirufa lenticrescens]